MMEHSQITIKGTDLQSAYGVYVVLIKDQEKTFYYVGQTGDAKYISARSPFYRIAAHLGYSTSTQNQVYKALSEQLGIDLFDSRKAREEMENWLADKKLDIHYFKVDDFEFLDELMEEHKQEHTDKRRKTLALETALLQELEGKKGMVRLNKNAVSYSQFRSAVPQAQEIIQILGL